MATRTELVYWPLALKHRGFRETFAAQGDEIYENPLGTWVSGGSPTQSFACQRLKPKSPEKRVVVRLKFFY